MRGFVNAHMGVTLYGQTHLFIVFGICVWEVEFYILVMIYVHCSLSRKPERREPGFFFLCRQKKTLPPEREKCITVILLPPVSYYRALTTF